MKCPAGHKAQFNSRSAHFAVRNAREITAKPNHDAQRQFIFIQDGIMNKVFVEMLEKLGYDIQITYVKKKSN